MGINLKVTMGSILTLTPALIITEDEMQRAIKILEEEFSTVEAA